MTAPQPNEYPQYAAGYIALASRHSNVIRLMHDLKNSTFETLMQLPASKADYTYRAGKWTIKQTIAHMIDAERVFAYRAYCISRGDKGVLPGFDQDMYVTNTNLANRTLQSLAAEFKTLREANLYFIDALTEDQVAAWGTMSSHPATVRAILYIMAGHELHHLKIFSEKYF